MTRILIPAALILLTVSLSVQGQEWVGPSGDCHEAQAFHLRAAMDYSQVRDQDYHLKAAQAAAGLEDLNETCGDWMQTNNLSMEAQP